MLSAVGIGLKQDQIELHLFEHELGFSLDSRRAMTALLSACSAAKIAYPALCLIASTSSTRLPSISLQDHLLTNYLRVIGW
jgi:hypothetical protein